MLSTISGRLPQRTRVYPQISDSSVILTYSLLFLMSYPLAAIVAPMVNGWKGTTQLEAAIL